MMAINQSYAALSALERPPVAFHFLVTFYVGGVVENPIDIRFQRVSGISADISPETYEEGGQNLFSHRFPNRVSYGNLILERGLMIGSPLAMEFKAALNTFTFLPGNVQVFLLDGNSDPVASWMFLKTYPVRWSISDLNATSNEVVIETMELAYTHFFPVKFF